MIKSLVVTAFLSFSFGGFPRENIQNAVNSNALNGPYCIREDFEFPYDFFNYRIDAGGYYYWYQDSNTYGTNAFSGFYISFDSGVFECEIIDLDGETILYQFDITLGQTFEDLSEYKQRFYMYISSSYYLTSSQASDFGSFFTNTGNIYNEKYTGWFTFNNVPPVSTHEFTVYGNMLINNTIFTSLHVYNGAFGGVVANAQYTNGVTTSSYTFINPEGYLPDFKIKNAYFTDVFLTATDVVNLSRFGTFQYIPYVQQYTFGEMIFNIMDAPIYMLSKLMGVELFGIEIYMAFISIVTIMLICFVIKHVV